MDFRVEMRPSKFEASTRVLLGEIRSDVESGMQATLQASIFWLALQANRTRDVLLADGLCPLFFCCSFSHTDGKK
jgi:hypothetical protein